MIAIVSLWAAALLAATLSPILLMRRRWSTRHPRTALALWHGALLTGVACLVASVVVAVALTVFAVDAAGGAIAVSIAGWSLLLVAGATAAMLWAGIERSTGQGTAPRRALESIPHEVTTLADGTSLWVCDDDTAFACALPGRPATIVVTRGLCARVTHAQLAAIIAHEGAHLRYRHSLALGVARVHAAILPRARSTGELVRATSLLVELIADDSAARRVGAAHLASALEAIATASGDASLSARADRLAARRWRRPRHPVTALQRFPA